MVETVIIPIIPKGKPLDLRGPILRALTEEARLAERGLKLPTATWRENVTFGRTWRFVGGIQEATTVSTGNQIYGFNEVGTPRHSIPRSPKVRGKLRFFRSGFASKTKPGRLVSGRGSRANTGLTFAKSVDHPGTKARNWRKIVAKNGDRRFKLRIGVEIRNELKKWSK